MRREARPIKIDRRLTGANIIDEPLQQVSSNQHYLFFTLLLYKYWLCNAEVVEWQIEFQNFTIYESDKWKTHGRWAGILGYIWVCFRYVLFSQCSGDKNNVCKPVWREVSVCEFYGFTPSFIMEKEYCSLW